MRRFSAIFRKLPPKTFGLALALVFSILLFLRNAQDFNPANHSVPGDFKVYLRAAERARAGIDPYVGSEGSPYKYSLGAVSPFLALPADDARAWMIFKLICVGLWFSSIALGSSLATWGEVGALLVGVAVSWKGLTETLSYGQIEFFLLFGAVLAAHQRPRPARVGLILGMLPPFKLPWAAILIPFLALYSFSKKSTSAQALVRLLAGFAVGVTFLGLLVPIALFGVDHTIAWSHSWLALLAHQPREIYFGEMNQGLLSTTHRWIGRAPMLGGIASIIAVLLVGHSTFTLARRLRTAEPAAAEPLALVSPWLIVVQLLNPLSWRWGSALLIGAPLAALKRPAQAERPVRASVRALRAILIVACIGSFLAQQDALLRWIGFKQWPDFDSFGLTTLLWMALLGLCV